MVLDNGNSTFPSARSRAVTLPAKMKGQAARQPATAPPQKQSESARGVVRHAVRERRDESNWNVSPGHRAERRHRQNRQRPLTLIKLVRSRSKVNYESRASDDVLRGFGQGRAVTACAGMRPTARRKDKFARSDKSHIVQHKTGRW